MWHTRCKAHQAYERNVIYEGCENTCCGAFIVQILGKLAQN